MDFAGFLSTLLFEQIQNGIREIAPAITTAVVGFVVYRINQFSQEQSALKKAETENITRQTLDMAAIAFVRSQYEKSRAVAKDASDSTGTDPLDRKDAAATYLASVFPKFSVEDIDAAIDAAVHLVRPEKTPLDPSV